MAKGKLLVSLWIFTITSLLSGCDVFNSIFQNSPNKTSNPQEQSVPDTKPPIPGNNGTINIQSKGVCSLELNWQPATDNSTSKENLLYSLYFTDNLPNADGFDKNSIDTDDWVILFKGQKQIEHFLVTDLSSGIYYFFLLLVSDQAENIASYTILQTNTSYDNGPVPGSYGKFMAYQKDNDFLSIKWDAAEDDLNTAEELSYMVIASPFNDLRKLESILPNEEGFVLCQDWTPGKTSLKITNIQAFQHYYINVLVKDQKGNISLYQPIYENLARLGDINADLIINSEDVKSIARYDAGLSPLDDFAAANINGDFNVDIIDALVIQQYNSGYLKSFGDNPVTKGTPLNAHTGTISLVTDKTSAKKNEIINLDLYLDHGDQNVGAFKWVIDYDPQSLLINWSDVIKNGENFTFEWNNKNVQQEKGRIIINGFNILGFNADPGLPMVKIKIMALKKGNTKITLNSVLLVDENLRTIGEEQGISFDCSVDITE
ncbi:MAG: hypothetical protein JXR70_03925 [Spirochaetales bacterium]|nr:hypothetical protein [Spirochaetales bacterium]